MEEEIVLGARKNGKRTLLEIAATQAASGKVCPVCQHQFGDFDDIKARDPHVYGDDLVCHGCNDEYRRRNQIS
jgi:uncharacterized protein YbaR (Trm112 family)